MPTVSEIITQSVVKQLEAGVPPWRKPWSTSVPQNLISKKPYRGLNVLALATQGYGSPYWLTFKQARQIDAHVRKGEKSTLVCFWKCGEFAKENPLTGEVENKKSVLLRYYHLFNAEQCDGLVDVCVDAWKSINTIDECESIANRMPNRPRIDRNSRAFYSPLADVVGIPSRNCFESAESYYTTLFHELIHSTGHASRLNRFHESTSDQQFGSESYSAEELVAEIGAAMLAGLAGISPATLANSASYLQSWINRLKSDSRLIISAASQAQMAVDYILGEGKEVL
jgi:antirestriction protein ArdC